MGADRFLPIVRSTACFFIAVVNGSIHELLKKQIPNIEPFLKNDGSRLFP